MIMEFYAIKMYCDNDAIWYYDFNLCDWIQHFRISCLTPSKVAVEYRKNREVTVNTEILTYRLGVDPE